MKHEEFFNAFKVMAEYFGVEPSEALMEIYWQTFKGWSLENLKKAYGMVMRTQKFPRLPFIYEIEEAIYGPIQDQAAIAYQTLVQTIKRIGPWETVIFEDGAIAGAVEGLGGWEEINLWSTDEWKFRKKDFEQLYLAHLRQGRTQPTRLVGAFDRINESNGQEGTNAPILVTREMKLIPQKKVREIENLKEDQNG